MAEPKILSWLGKFELLRIMIFDLTEVFEECWILEISPNRPRFLSTDRGYLALPKGKSWVSNYLFSSRYSWLNLQIPVPYILRWGTGLNGWAARLYAKLIVFYRRPRYLERVIILISFVWIAVKSSCSTLPCRLHRIADVYSCQLIISFL